MDVNFYKQQLITRLKNLKTYNQSTQKMYSYLAIDTTLPSSDSPRSRKNADNMKQ